MLQQKNRLYSILVLGISCLCALPAHGMGNARRLRDALFNGENLRYITEKGAAAAQAAADAAERQRKRAQQEAEAKQRRLQAEKEEAERNIVNGKTEQVRELARQKLARLDEEIHANRSRADRQEETFDRLSAKA